MDLSVAERIVLLGEVLRGVEGNFLALRTVRELREALSFTDEERDELDFEESASEVRWRHDVPQTRDIALGSGAVSIITKQLREMDKRERLAERHLTLCEKFLAEAEE